MADQPNSEAATSETEGAQPPIVVNLQYVKDLSFEVPNAPQIFAVLQNQPPEIPINVDVQARQIQETLFEVTLALNIEAKAGDQPAFIVELVYGGLFTVNVPQEHLGPVLLIECPRLMFPFVRNIVADVTRDGGFPPLMLTPIDFVALYRHRLEQAQQQQGESGEGA